MDRWLPYRGLRPRVRKPPGFVGQLGTHTNAPTRKGPAKASFAGKEEVRGVVLDQLARRKDQRRSVKGSKNIAVQCGACELRALKQHKNPDLEFRCNATCIGPPLAPWASKGRVKFDTLCGSDGCWKHVGKKASRSTA